MINHRNLISLSGFLLVVFSISACKGQQKTAESSTAVAAQNASPRTRSVNPYPRIPMQDFTRVWTGEGNCLSGTTLTIAVRDSFSVFVSGLFGAADKVSGTVAGYAIGIEPQILPSLGAGKTVQGKLLLTNDRQSLRAFLTLKSGTASDTCNGALHP